MQNINFRKKDRHFVHFQYFEKPLRKYLDDSTTNNPIFWIFVSDNWSGHYRMHRWAFRF